MYLRTDAELKVPAARTADLVTTESKDEVLVYDQAVHHIHHLNATAAKVWRLCDGERTVSEIAVEAGIAEEAVKLAIRTLEDAQLLDGPLASELRSTQSRRAFAKKIGIAAVPAIVSITAPIAKAAASGCPTSCKDPSECQVPGCAGSCKDGDGVVHAGSGRTGTCTQP